MKILAAVAATLVVFVPQAAAKPGHEGVLAIVANGQIQMLERLDPLTLARSGPAVRVGRDSAAVVAYASDGNLVAVVSGGGGMLKLVSLNAGIVMRSALVQDGVVAGLWTRPTRLVLLSSGPYDSGFSVVKLGRRIRSLWHPLSGNVVAWTQTATAIVAVVAPDDGIGPARLLVIDGSGADRTAALPTVAAGMSVGGTAQQPEITLQSPALAVDPAGTRAFVASPTGGFAVVDLATLAVESHASRSLAKNISGAQLSAAWYAPNLIALSGVDYTNDDSSPRGLTLLDTRDWSARRVSNSVSWVVAAGGMLLGCGQGLSGYGADGRLAYHALGTDETGYVTPASQYAYTTKDGLAFTILDPSTGAVVAHVSAAQPTTVVGTW